MEFGKWVRHRWITILTCVLVISIPAMEAGLERQWEGVSCTKDSISFPSTTPLMSEGRTSSEDLQGRDLGSPLGLHGCFSGWKAAPIVSHLMASEAIPMGEEKAHSIGSGRSRPLHSLHLYGVGNVGFY